MTTPKLNAPATSPASNGSASSWKWNGRYPVRCKILDVAGHEVMPGIVAKTPKASRPHIGKLGTAHRIRFGEVAITLDDGGTLKGSECWWLPMPNRKVSDAAH